MYHIKGINSYKNNIDYFDYFSKSLMKNIWWSKDFITPKFKHFNKMFKVKIMPT